MHYYFIAFCTRGGSNAAIVHHVSFAQITCSSQLYIDYMLFCDFSSLSYNDIQVGLELCNSIRMQGCLTSSRIAIKLVLG